MFYIIILLISLPFIGFIAQGYRTANKLIKEKPIWEYYNKLQKSPSYIPIDEISTNIKFIIICLEDSCFFIHRGYNLKRIAYAFFRNFKHSNPIGGSTITQQLAKNMYFSFKKTYKRKIAEFFVARKLEKTLSKEQIFDIYLNIIYYGMEQYGIKEACEFYYSKSPSEISLNQAITLGCLLPAPSVYNPLTENNLFYKARTIALQRLVHLNVMKKTDIIVYQSSEYNANIKDSVTTEYEIQYKKLYYEHLKNKKRIGNKTGNEL